MNNNNDESTAVPGASGDDEASTVEQQTMDLGDPSANVPLAFLETEVKRLQARWAGIESEVRARDQRIDELQQQVDARDLIAANLTQRLEEAKQTEDSLQEQILTLECSVAEYKLSQAERDVKLSAKQEEHATLEAAAKKLRDEIADAEQQIEALHQNIAQEREAAAETDRRSTDLEGVSDELRRKIQDLELYIDGRTQQWEAKEEQLKDYRDTISGMETVLKERDKELRAAGKLKEELSLRILDLERCAAELDGRRQERETAYQDLEARMAAQAQETAQVRADFGQRIQQADAAIDKAAAAEQSTIALQRGIERRDESITELEQALQQQRADHERFKKDYDKQSRRVEELEHGLEERLMTNQELRAALKEAHEEVKETEADMKGHVEQIATLGEEVQLAKTELAHAREDLERLGEQHRDALDQADEAADRATELERSVQALTAERDTLQDELLAQQELVQVLESDLEGKRETLDVLDRNVDRIQELGKSLQELDHDLSDFEESVAVASTEAEDQLELISANELLAANGADSAPVPGAKQISRLMVSLSGELGTKYPIYKRETTIGRSRRSDIQVHSKFISRIHARIIEDEGGVVIEDTGSKNGVTVNSSYIAGKRQPLRDGDTICVGEHKFKFVERAAAH